MRSDKLDADVEAQSEAGVLYRLLDLVFPSRGVTGSTVKPLKAFLPSRR